MSNGTGLAGMINNLVGGGQAPTDGFNRHVAFNPDGTRANNFAPTVGGLQQAAPPPPLGHPGLPSQQQPSGQIAGPGGEIVQSMPAQLTPVPPQQPLTPPNPQLIPPNKGPTSPLPPGPQPVMNNFPQAIMRGFRGGGGLLG